MIEYFFIFIILLYSIGYKKLYAQSFIDSKIRIINAKNLTLNSN